MTFLWKTRVRNYCVRGCCPHCQLQPALPNTSNDAGQSNLQPLYFFFFSFFLTSLYIAGVTQLLSAQGSGTSCCRMLPFCSKCIFFSPCGLEQFDARKGHAAFWSVFLPLQSKAALREASKGSWSVLQGWEQGRLAGSVLVLPVSSRKESNAGTHLVLGTGCA